MVQELQTAAEDMQKLGEAMAELFERTAQAIRTGSLLFEQAASVADSRFAGKRRCSVMRQRLNLEASSVVMQTPGASCLRSKSLFLSNINRY